MHVTPLVAIPSSSMWLFIRGMYAGGPVSTRTMPACPVKRGQQVEAEYPPRSNTTVARRRKASAVLRREDPCTETMIYRGRHHV